jgi:hypothetical protein
MANHVRERGTIAEGSNVSKNIRLSSYDLCFMIMVIKHTELTVKQQENAVFPETIII